MSAHESTSSPADFVPPRSPVLDARLRDSWESNATAWTAAVREQRIPSRRAGTDAAVVAEITAALDEPRVERSARRVLDVGCGEGWLARAVADPSREVVGIDGSVGLIEHANALATPGVRFSAVSYEELIADANAVVGPWDVVVCNFALLGDPLSPLLRALGQRLAPEGCMLIQTVHPWVAMGDGSYECGWREEQFQGFGVQFPTAMPWYFRTMASWQNELDAAGLVLRALQEPLHPDTHRPLSLLLRCERRPQRADAVNATTRR